MAHNSSSDTGDTMQKVAFTAQVNTRPTVFKAGDDFIIWGPASVEIVDKEGDLIEASALSDALPQLLRRARLSLEHSDQIVGKILDRFEPPNPVEVEINGNTYKREEFPTDVLELDGMDPALYVAGEVWNDTRQAQQTRKDIEEGVIDSYSISGEAIVTSKQIEDGEPYDKIQDMDLSAVTLCEEGMNQEAKFARIENDGETVEASVDGEAGVRDSPSTANNAVAAAKSALTKTMSDNNNSGDTEDLEKKFEAILERHIPDELNNPDDLQRKFEEVLDSHLPDGEIATKREARRYAVTAARKANDRASEQDDTDDGRHSDYEDMDDPTEGNSEATVPKDQLTRAVSEAIDDANLVKHGDLEGAIRSLLSEEKGEMPEELQDGDYEEDEEEMDDDDDDDEVPEELQNAGGGKGYSVKDLEERLPADVFEVVREYVDEEDDDEEEEEDMPVEMSDSSESVDKADLQAAVSDILKGEDISKTEGVTAGSPTDTEPATEETEDTSHGGNPALAKWYSE